MSKQQDAKKAQGYNPKPTPHTCGNCAHLKSDKTTERGMMGEYTKKTNIRCGLGGFAVKKNGTCNEFEIII